MCIVHLLIITMQSAFDTIIDTYDYETCKEIVNHGCQSGVCTQHIYYGDTIKFFDTYEDEIIDYIGDTLGSEVNEQLWSKNSCNIHGYKNDTVWAFIELVAMHVVDDYEDAVTDLKDVADAVLDDEPIKLYAHYTDEEIKVLKANGFNPVRSMNDTRYAQV